MAGIPGIIARDDDAAVVLPSEDRPAALALASGHGGQIGRPAPVVGTLVITFRMGLQEEADHMTRETPIRGGAKACRNAMRLLAQLRRGNSPGGSRAPSFKRSIQIRSGSMADRTVYAMRARSSRPSIHKWQQAHCVPGHVAEELTKHDLAE